MSVYCAEPSEAASAGSRDSAADCIVTVGEGYRDKLVARGVPGEMLTILPNGVDRRVFHPDVDGSRVRAEFGLGDRFVCAYVGTIGMGSGLDVALRAGERLRQAGRDDIVLLLVGDGALRAELETRAQELGLDNVIFTGLQPKARMPEFVAAADACLVHLIRSDLFRSVRPSKIFEASAMARPMILGVEGFAADLVGGADAGVCIEPENDAELVEAVVRLAEDSSLRRRLGLNGLAQIAERYDIDRVADEYLELLASQLL